MNSKSGCADRTQEDLVPGTEHTPSKPGHRPTPSLSPPTHTLWGHMISYVLFSRTSLCRTIFLVPLINRLNMAAQILCFPQCSIQLPTETDWLVALRSISSFLGEVGSDSLPTLDQRSASRRSRGCGYLLSEEWCFSPGIYDHQSLISQGSHWQSDEGD